MPRRKLRRDEKPPPDTEPANGDCQERSLYEVLGIERTATQEDIKKAYHKLALRLHPDKNPGDESAKEKFQCLQNVISILGDPEKRSIYDQTGSIDDAELSSESVQNLYHFFRTVYRKITEEDIEEFASNYRGSEEEKRDLKGLYTKCKGNMDRVFDQLICSIRNKDYHRFMDVIDDAILAGELKEYNVYRKWATEVSKQPRPKNPLAPVKKRKGASESGSDRLTIISERHKQRMDSCTSALLSKYGSNKETKNNFVEPSEEEFQAARQRILAKTKKRAK